MEEIHEVETVSECHGLVGGVVWLCSGYSVHSICTGLSDKEK